MFLNPTVQDELFRQPRRQPPYFTSSYHIQLTSLFDQAFSSISDHPPWSIGDPKGLLDHLVCSGSSRSSTLHRASWIPYYVGLPLSHETGRRRPCSFIRRYYYLVAMEGWSWSLHQGGQALLCLASCASCYRRSSK